MLFRGLKWDSTIGVDFLNALIAFIRNHLSAFGKMHLALSENAKIMLLAFAC